jgi:hypothetical protein
MSIEIKQASKSPWKEVIVLTKETLEYASICGSVNIIKSRFNIVKIAWAMCVLGSFALCAYSIVSLIGSFLNYDTTTNIEIENLNKIPFPIISICNINPFSTSYATQYFENIFNSTELNFNNIYVAKQIPLILNQSQRLMFGASLNEIILSCSFKGIQCNLTEDFSYYWDLNYGNCFR